MESLSEATQEYLESIYWLYESGIERTQANLARALQVSQPSVSEMLRRMVDDDLVSRDEAKLINFTVRGREVAERIVARHRLVEAYLVKVMGIPWDDVHEEAHAMEHSISPRLEAKMLEMIGDVHTCPHGHPIGDYPREPGEPLPSVPVGSTIVVLRLENEAEEMLHYMKRHAVEPGQTYTVAGPPRRGRGGRDGAGRRVRQRLGAGRPGPHGLGAGGRPRRRRDLRAGRRGSRAAAGRSRPLGHVAA